MVHRRAGDAQAERIAIKAQAGVGIGHHDGGVIDAEEQALAARLPSWYGKDYEEHTGSVRQFIKNHTEEELHPFIDDGRSIRFVGYDWSLNKPGNFPELDS